MNTIKYKTIAIVGGGPGGLTLARLLQMQGINVKVYERDAHKDARAKGATLDLHEDSGLKALQAAGLMPAFYENYRLGADKLRLVNKHAFIVAEDNAEQLKERNRPEIDRGPLQEILLNSLQAGTVVWNKQFKALKKQGDGWLLTFADGTAAAANIVIAADGANSKLRPYITDIKPFYTGIMVVEGAVYDAAKACPNAHVLLDGGKIFAMDEEKTLIVSSKGDGSLVFYTGCRKVESWVKDSGINFEDKNAVTDWFNEEYAGWDGVFTELFVNATLPFVTRPIYCMPAHQTWEPLPNLTMLGDAAHLMPPFAGEGVNMAMLDALELSEQLTSIHFTNTQNAIAAYEKAMRSRASVVAIQSLESGELMHSPQGMAFLQQVVG